MPVTNSLIAWGMRFDSPSYALRVDVDGTTETLSFPAAPTGLNPATDYFMGVPALSGSLCNMLQLCG